MMTLLLESNSYTKLSKIKGQLSLSQYLSTKPSGLLQPFHITNCWKYLNGKNYILTLLPHTQVKKKKRNVYPDLKLSLVQKVSTKNCVTFTRPGVKGRMNRQTLSKSCANGLIDELSHWTFKERHSRMRTEWISSSFPRSSNFHENLPRDIKTAERYART